MDARRNAQNHGQQADVPDEPGRLAAGLTRRQFSAGTASAALLAATAGGAATAQTPEAAGETAPAFEELIIALSDDTPILDPDLYQGAKIHAIYNLIWSQPVKLNDAGEPAPDLAESWEYEDDTTLVFHLREDVTWHDGEPFTADDVVFTWERMIDPERESLAAARFTPWLENVVARDDFTVVFTTFEPFAPALHQIAANYQVAPRHDIEARGEAEYGLNPIGTGPYRAIEWQPQQFHRLEAVESWWGGPVHFPKVRFVTIVEDFPRVTALLSGDVHIAAEPSISTVSQIEETDGYHLARGEGSSSVMFLQIPHQNKRPENTPAMDDKRVRQALNYALDRQTIVETVGQGFLTPIPGPFEPASWANPENAWDLAYPYDPERARQLLSEAGYADGFTLYLGTPVNNDLLDVETVEASVPYFEAIGLTVELTALEWSAYWPGVQEEGPYSLYYLLLGGGTGDPHSSISLYMTAVGREHGFFGTDPELDPVIHRGAEILDFEERRQYYQEVVYPAIIETAPWVFLWSPDLLYGVDNRIEYEADAVGRSWIDVMRVRSAAS